LALPAISISRVAAAAHAGCRARLLDAHRGAASFWSTQVGRHSFPTCSHSNQRLRLPALRRAAAAAQPASSALRAPSTRVEGQPRPVSTRVGRTPFVPDVLPAARGRGIGEKRRGNKSGEAPRNTPANRCESKKKIGKPPRNQIGEPPQIGESPRN